nr:MAG TPA: hypothetical protein [Microviridae sp.]
MIILFFFLKPRLCLEVGAFSFASNSPAKLVNTPSEGV